MLLIPTFYLIFILIRFKIKYHPEESTKRKEEQIQYLKVRQSFSINRIQYFLQIYKLDQLKHEWLSR